MFKTKKELDEYLNECSDYITCLECNKRYKQLSTHLPRKHQINTAEYKKKYGIPLGTSLDCKKNSESKKFLALQRLKEPSYKEKLLDGLFKGRQAVKKPIGKWADISKNEITKITHVYVKDLFEKVKESNLDIVAYIKTHKVSQTSIVRYCKENNMIDIWESFLKKPHKSKLEISSQIKNIIKYRRKNYTLSSISELTNLPTSTIANIIKTHNNNINNVKKISK